MEKAFYFSLGIVLLILNIWFIDSARKAFLSREIVIAPFQVIGETDDAEKLGKTLASMLQVRLEQVQRELDQSQTSLIQASRSVTGSNRTLDDTTTDMPRLLLPVVNMRTEIFEPANINVAVSGVEVGGVFSWAQRAIVKPRTLNFTVYIEAERAIITANLGAFSGSRADVLWIETKPNPIDITDKIAYALIQRKMADHPSSDIETLNVDEVQTLLETLFAVAELNRKADLGRPIENDIARLFPGLEEIALKAPEWPELNFYAASMAEGAGKTDRAFFFYSRLQKLVATSETTTSIMDPESLQDKINELAPEVETTVATREQRFVQTAKEYAERLNLTGEDPAIAFVPSSHPNIFAQWNTEARQYDVNPERISARGLAEYVALMGRFMDRNYDRCFGDDAVAAAVPDLWNEFRLTLVTYILSTEPEQTLSGDRESGFSAADFESYPSRFSLARTLKGMEIALGDRPEPVRKIALALLNEFQCDWTRGDLLEKTLTINRKLELMSDDVIKAAFAAD